MEPFLRPIPADGVTPELCPPGWVAQPLGVWHGQPVEAVYDPVRYATMVLRPLDGDRVSARMAAALQANGWVCRDADGACEWWVHDRLVEVRARLARLECRPVGPGHGLSRSR